MGCICSRDSSPDLPPNIYGNNEGARKATPERSLHPVSAPKTEALTFGEGTNGRLSVDMSFSRPLDSNAGQFNGRTIIVERASTRRQHQRRATVDLGLNRGQRPMAQDITKLCGMQGVQGDNKWPSWLTSVAAEAVHGWLPRKPESFEKLEKIGQGTYSTVYKARDRNTGKIVAMKKVRFVNMDPDSVRFMAREIVILRKLDHPNVMKLECLATSTMSDSLYLVFEYMEHDLAGLLASGNKFTEPQIKCYLQQLFRGLEHCFSRGVLHRDIKGSNLLINNDGMLKIGDFGLATSFNPNQRQQLTSRVVTLWYRAPELLLGSTDYGTGVDMWSAGCIVAELFAGKPIMPGRTEVEQMHKIFKLCGSPSEDYWKKMVSPHATSYKPHQPYPRRVAETFQDFPLSALELVESLLTIAPEERPTASAALQSEFFTAEPLPCDPSSLPKYRPSNELYVKFKEEEARRLREGLPGQGQEVATRDLMRETDLIANHCYKVDTVQDNSGLKSVGPDYIPKQGNKNLALTIDTRSIAKNSCCSMVHPSAVGLTWSNDGKVKEEDEAQLADINGCNSRNIGRDLRIQTLKEESSAVYMPKKNRLHYSGPLMGPGGNLDDMLREHERHIQQAVRKARTTTNGGNKQHH